jgi:hypothetical protein
MYFNDKHGAYCDINPHHQSKSVQIKTLNSFVYPTAEEARVLALALIATADEIDRISAIDLGPCTNCKGELRAVNTNFAICLRCETDSISISDKTKT